MRTAQWLYKRWRGVGLSLPRLKELSGLSERTLYEIQRQSRDYAPSKQVIQALAGPLRYGAGAVEFLLRHSHHRRDFRGEFDPDELDALAGPITSSIGDRPPPDRPPADAPPAAPGAGTPGGPSQPGAADNLALEAVERLRADVRRELTGIKSLMTCLARFHEDTGRTVRLELTKEGHDHAGV